MRFCYIYSGGLRNLMYGMWGSLVFVFFFIFLLMLCIYLVGCIFFLRIISFYFIFRYYYRYWFYFIFIFMGRSIEFFDKKKLLLFMEEIYWYIISFF